MITLSFLWGEGEGRATPSNFLAALQDYDPKLKHLPPLSWRLMKAWSTNEVPVRAPPLTEPVLRAMIGWSFFYEHYTCGFSLLVAFYGLLPTGELLALQAWQVHMTSGSQPAVINLGLTKAGKRQGAAESVTISELSVVQLLWKWKSRASPFQFLTDKLHVWRSMFQTCLEGLKIQEWGFRPYSLGRGDYMPFCQSGVFGPSFIVRSMDRNQNCKKFPQLRFSYVSRHTNLY